MCVAAAQLRQLGDQLTRQPFRRDTSIYQDCEVILLVLKDLPRPWSRESTAGSSLVHALYGGLAAPSGNLSTDC